MTDWCFYEGKLRVEEYRGKKQRVRTWSRRQEEGRFRGRILPCPVLFCEVTPDPNFQDEKALWHSRAGVRLSRREIIWGGCTGVSCVAKVISTEHFVCYYPRLQRKYQDGCVNGSANTRIHHLFSTYQSRHRHSSWECLGGSTINSSSSKQP